MGPKRKAKKTEVEEKKGEQTNMVRTSRRLADKDKGKEVSNGIVGEEKVKGGNTRKRKVEKDEAKAETAPKTTRTRINARKRGQQKVEEEEKEEQKEPAISSPPRKITRKRTKAKTKTEQMELDEEENIKNVSKNDKTKAKVTKKETKQEENKNKSKNKAKREINNKIVEREPEVVKEVSQNTDRVMKCLSKPSPVKKPPECADIYDMATYGEEEFGPEPEVKKKKRRKVNKKMTAGDIILAFGSETKERAWTKLKEIKNIKTPPVVQKVPNPVKHKPVPALLPPDPIPIASYQAPPDSPAGFSRDCDDYLPSFNDHAATTVSQVSEVENVFAAPAQLPGISISSPRQKQPSLSPTSSTSTTLPSGNLHPRYKTPAVPKHVRKVEGKVSTPRLVDSDKAPELKLSTKELVKTCFGFDDSSEADSEGESLLGGISPVKGLSVLGGSGSNMTERSSFQSFSTSSRLSAPSSVTRFSNASVKSNGPYRFEVALVPRQKKSEALIKASMIQKQRKVAEAARLQKTMKKEVAKPAQESPKKDDRVNGEKVVTDDDTNSLYEEEEGDKENKEVEKRDKQNAEEIATEQPQLDLHGKGEEDDDGELRSAFTVMKEKNLDRSVYSNRRKSGEVVKAPQKAEGKTTKGAKRKRQALITEVMVKRGKKQTNKAEETDQEEEEEERSSKDKKKKKTGKKQVLSAGSSSPVKMTAKETQRMNNWVADQTSHFSEIEDYDISFF